MHSANCHLFDKMFMNFGCLILDFYGSELAAIYFEDNYMNIQKILCPIDFSDFSVNALRYACAFAEQYRSQLMVYYCLPVALAPVVGLSPSINNDWQLSSADAKERLGECIAPYSQHHNLEIQTRVDFGNAAAQILETATEEEADLIVMGTHGLTGYEALLMGSTTNKVLHKVKIPVLVVCKPTRTILSGDPDEPLLIGKILCAVDAEHVNLQMLSRAMFMARSNHATITFFTALSSDRERGLGDLRELIQPDKETSCRVEFLTSCGTPVEEIVKAAQSREIDLLIMGHRKISSLFDGLGSVTLRVVPQSSCPVLVVRD
ncbi:MAG: hypothetical protein C5B54_05780 [Acidobacteria bacterium]|nr:MAG: hypothetical protein C5B54_05780 [Acidobacteriota bacterium]